MFFSLSKTLLKPILVSQPRYVTPYRHSCSRIEAVIGLEVHAQIETDSKLFSRGGSKYMAPPNSQLDLFDISLPGTLPSLNKLCVKSAIKTALALNCKIQQRSYFDRKHYYYSDLPAGYQLTQYYKPIAINGYIDCIVTPYHRTQNYQSYDLIQFVRQEKNVDEKLKPYIKRSAIKQIQLEQDSARSFYDVIVSKDGRKQDFSLVDFNRSGVALMEIVFEPDLKDQHEATSVLTELITILRSIGTCSCQLQEGSLRVDANISINSIDGQKLDHCGRVELKNLNSIKSLSRGIEHEILRQGELLRSGKAVERETRTFDSKTGRSIVLRKKEESTDYRYFPEPSLPPIEISESEVAFLNETLKKNPFKEGMELASQHKLPLDLTKHIISIDGMKSFLLDAYQVSKYKNLITMASYLLHTKDLIDSDAKNILDDVSFSEGSSLRIGLQPKYFAGIVDLVQDNLILYGTGYELIKLYVFNREKREPRELAESFGWLQINSNEEIEKYCRMVMDSMKGVSKKYAKTGDIRHLKVLMQKLDELSSGRVSFEMAKLVFNRLLRLDSRLDKMKSGNTDKTQSSCDK